MGFSCFRFSESVHLRLSLNVCCFRPLFLQMFFSTIFFLKMSNILLFSHSFLRFCSTFHSTIESPSAVFFHLLYFSTLNSLSFLPSVSFFIFLSFYLFCLLCLCWDFLLTQLFQEHSLLLTGTSVWYLW